MRNCPPIIICCSVEIAGQWTHRCAVVLRGIVSPKASFNRVIMVVCSFGSVADAHGTFS